MTVFKPKIPWPNIHRATYKVPMAYGYVASPDDPLTLIPDVDQMEAYEAAFDLIDEGHPFRRVHADFVLKTGYPGTFQTLRNLWMRVRGNEPRNPRRVMMKRTIRKNAPKTPQEKAIRAAKRRLQGSRQAVHHAQERLKRVTEDRTKVVEPKLDTTNILGVFEQVEEPIDTREVGFRPHPGPQTTFLAASEQEVLYGGAAGGGKSYALLADPMRWFNNGKFSGLLLRRTNDEMRELKWKSRELYPDAFPGCTWREKDSMWLFPSGAQMWMTYLERDDDVQRYVGQSFSYIAFDELTQYSTPFAWDFMRSRLRSADDIEGDTTGLPLYMRATTNPGGPGHGWVKKMFIDPAPYGEAFNATDIDSGTTLVYPENYHNVELRGKPLFKRRFIPAKLSDNPSLFRSGQYETNLLSLPEMKRRQLLEGDWNIADGAAFPEWKRDVHVVAPFDIPSDWRRFRAADFGYSSFSAVLWFAIDPVYETLVVYRELYVSKMTGADLSRRVAEIERNANENVMYGMLDSSVWHTRGNTGPSIAEEMTGAGTKWRPSDRGPNSRINGRNRLHELLKIDDFGKPGIIFFNTCRQVIADIPVIPTDPHGGDDIDDRYASDHTYDALRYGIMSRPRGAGVFDFATNSIGYSYAPADKSFGY